MSPTTAELLAIVDSFQVRQFPNALGAIDGKHIVIRIPVDGDSHHCNYKHTHSVVLLAIAGPDLEYIYADIGTNGRVNDGGLWNRSSISHAIESNSLCLPNPCTLAAG